MDDPCNACVLVTSRCPDPRCQKQRLAPFSTSRNGITTTSTSGFVVLHGNQPVVLASAAAVYPLLRQQRREQGSLAGAGLADLVPGANLQATTAASDSSGNGSGSETVALSLLGLAECPGVRQALLQLLAAPSIAGPTGWQLGWLLHSGHQQQASLAAASHIAVMLPASPEGAAALACNALSWPAAAGSGGSSALALLHGQPLAAVGAPFGALAPQHFDGFIATGVLSAVVPACSLSAGSAAATEAPALLLSDLRCSPGMEGGPICATLSAPASQRRLVGMLLPPLKAPAAHVELALAAPAAAVAAAAAEVLCRRIGATADCSSGSSDGGGVAASTAAAQQAVPCMPAQLPPDGAELPAVGAALSGVVAVVAGSSWASGVVISSAGHLVTNAHLLQPTAAVVAAAPAVPPSSSVSRDAPLQLAPASAAEAAASAATALQMHPPVRVLLPAMAGGSGGGRWATADVLHIFTGPLDLAVLQLRQDPQQTQQPHQKQQPAHVQRAALPQPLMLSWQAPRAGQPVRVLGFPAFNPRGSPLGCSPLVTSGNLAKVRCLESSDKPAMLLTTAAVHSGASGGAVLDATSGQLVGLVTSNAKHSSGGAGSSSGGAGGADAGACGAEGGSHASPTVLPHLNFGIPAAQLLPVVAAAQRAAAAGPAGAAAALESWQALDAAAAASSELQQVWRLDHNRRQKQQEEEQPRRQTGGAFGGAAPPAKLRLLLEQLQPQPPPQIAKL